MKWAGHIALKIEKWNASRDLVGKPEGRRPTGRPRSRWEDNIVVCRPVAKQRLRNKQLDNGGY
jgi:hypothetical protein